MPNYLGKAWKGRVYVEKVALLLRTAWQASTSIPAFSIFLPYLKS
jgi:hypothetical protein